MTPRSRSCGLDDRGSVTAEIVVTLPAVVMVLVACLGGLGLASSQLRAQDSAADAARVLGRGDAVAIAEQLVARSVPGAALVISRPQALVCATVVVEQRLLLVPLRVEGASCALDGGR
ncbi:TadE family type IV pilus minor pilin [Microcella sp.]|uniref:TadE family type IV pilus minor pilin n=1 Tax=Microcella sp. TaxID=1913979 RepID=UPI003F7175B5